MPRIGFLLSMVVSLLTLTVSAQQSPTIVGGTVTGTVFCADTGRPARFAIVTLAPTTSPTSAVTNIVAAATAPRTTSKPAPMPTTTSADGAFLFTDVPPGTYYLQVVFAGYLNPADLFSKEDLQSTDPEMHRRVLDVVPNVVISGNEALRLDVRIDRAAAILGRILYDDGSPAAGWRITAQSADSHSKLRVIGEDLFTTITDDRGNFRLPSIPPGSYILHATLQSTFIRGNSSTLQSRTFTMSVYSGSTLRIADAIPIPVTAGEERPGADIIVPLHGLHTLIGHVAAQSDGHAITSGYVALSSPDDPAFSAQTAIDTTGNFIFYYLPGKSNYALIISGNVAVPFAPSAAPIKTINGVPMRPAFDLHPYAPAKLAIRIEDADVTDLAVTLQNEAPKQ